MNKGVIILNKPFTGGWLDKSGNIGHEIINFFLTDDGDYYVYNNPFGSCPDDIYVNQPSANEKYKADYLVLTSQTRNKEFNIEYVIELKEKLHRLHAGRGYKQQEKVHDEMMKIIKERRILYHYKYPDYIFNETGSLYVTFKASALYKAKAAIAVKGINYDFRRNKGYLYEPENNKSHNSDYDFVLKLINDNFSNGNLEKVQLSRLEQPASVSSSTPTFLDLLNLTGKEEAYTYLLYDVLNNGNLFNAFCDYFKGDKVFNSDYIYGVSCEKRTEYGRMDLCGEHKKQRVVIENKVYSGLNDINSSSKTSQLSNYFKWAGENNCAPLCFITCPDYRIPEIREEIKRYDPLMLNEYITIPYSEIGIFLNKNKDKLASSYTHRHLIDDIINAFSNLGSYKNKKELYSDLFYKATL